jgi:ABC-type arginine transport system permease subunit
MTNRKNLAGVALTVTAIAICSLIVGAAVLAPAGAASDISTTTPYADSSDDFPDQFVTQPEQIMMMMYYYD